ncbi:MAG: zinc ribbon domain-containing protein, partial [Desulfomonilaceae bacterium]
MKELTMPITKYRCLDCGKEFSKIYFSLDHAPTKCTVCGASNIVEAGPTFRDDGELA